MSGAFEGRTPAPSSPPSGGAAGTQHPPPPRPLRLRERDEEEGVSINHMALTDVIFILLIFFISLSQLRTSNLDLDLPEVATDQEEQPADDAPPAVVELAKDGRVLLDGRELEVEAIVADLVERRERTGVEPRVRVRGDQEGNYGKFVEVMAALADAKLGQIEIAVQSTR